MGNHQHSHKSYGGVIQFGKAFYYPGEVVNGTIYMNVMDAISSKGIELELKCTEAINFLITKHVRVPLPDGTHRTDTIREEIKDKKKHFVNKCNLPMFHINVGQHGIPFSFLIPGFLPGSFEYYNTNESAYIKFEVKVIVHHVNHEKKSKFSSILIVRQNPSLFNYPQNLTDTKKITAYCFVDKGTATLNVSYQKNFFALDEILQTHCQLDNTRCKMNATGIRVQLFQRIKLRGKEHEFQQDNIYNDIYKNHHYNENRVEEEKNILRLISETVCYQRCVSFILIFF
jgi:hypothetical protein